MERPVWAVITSNQPGAGFPARWRRHAPVVVSQAAISWGGERTALPDDTALTRALRLQITKSGGGRDAGG